MSLLGSKYTPAQATKTMSAALRDAVPPGTLSYDKWTFSKGDKKVAKKIERKNEQEEAIFKGAVLNTLEATAESLFQAASRLGKDVTRETKYWEQLVSLTNVGYPVFRMPSDKRTLAVQFGAREAGPLFRDRGIAALRANDDGTVKLNQSLTSRPKTTRFRIMENNKLVYTSGTTATSALSALDASLETLVRQAQDSLFEEELFHEMVMESRDLQPLGVKLRGDVIHIPLSARQDETAQRECLVDLLPLDEAHDTPNNTNDDSTYDALAVTVRLLLSHVFRQRLHRRSQIPPPLSERKRPTPISSIIRPIMAVSQHESAHQPLNNYLTQVSKSLKAAGLPILFNDAQATALSSFLQNLNSKPRLKRRSILYSFLDSLAKPITNIISFTVPSADEKDDTDGVVTIEISTNLSAPQFGTVYTLCLPKHIAKLMHGNEASAAKLHFDSVSDLTSFISDLLALDISSNVLLPKIGGEWKHADGLAAISKVVEHDDVKKKVGIKVLVEDEGVIVARIWLGTGKEDGREVWDGGDAKQGLVQVVERWMGEYMEVEE
jgi:mediator of RNA polymerase II transcription subunit 17